MRYVVLTIMGVFGVLLSGSLLRDISVADIPLQIDLILLMALSFAVAEKSSMPIIFAAASGLLMDIMYSTIWGTYALCYTVTTALVVMFFRKAGRFNVLYLFVVGAGGYIIKELLMALLVFIQSARFSMPVMLVYNILPSAILTGGLMFIAYWLISRLMKLGWMRPRAAYHFDDI
ncbi:rod shape-determining protein MreD [Christensenella timonensis]|uniref:rod shape-determining protein MreD n=1 Tax=Christensenella timonensis TaxID=1816678 RepID=UPI0009ED7A11|nr:rod shape-determining protein MreD [Christensenella timonensis]